MVFELAKFDFDVDVLLLLLFGRVNVVALFRFLDFVEGDVGEGIVFGVVQGFYGRFEGGGVVLPQDVE